MKTQSCSGALVCAFFFASILTLLGQGSLTPPGAPAPTLKTLSQVEPRSDVQKLTGDASNLFIINQPGSYYLTANVNGASGKSGISIQASNVVLDLNGFALIGVGGAGKGIIVPGSQVNVAVRNGTVQNWPGDGVDLSPVIGFAVNDLRVFGNTGIGISTGDTGLVNACTSRQNGGDNIRTGAHVVITKCSAIQSTLGNGINAGGYSLISQCVANFNNQHGIRCFQRCRVSDCIATNNSQSGVLINIAGTVERTFCNQNAVCGILSDAGGFVDILNNNSSGNGGTAGAGIRVSNASAHRIEGNNVGQNFIGIDVLSGRNVIFRNVAIANTTDYNIVAGNTLRADYQRDWSRRRLGCRGRQSSNRQFPILTSSQKSDAQINVAPRCDVSRFEVLSGEPAGLNSHPLILRACAARRFARNVAPSRMSAPAIAVEGLVKTFKRRREPAVRAVDDLSFTVQRGSIFGLLGPNGAGKTTTLRILTTLMQPTAGRVRVMDFDPITQPLEVRRRIGVVIQESAVELFLSVRDNL